MFGWLKLNALTLVGGALAFSLLGNAYTLRLLGKCTSARAEITAAVVQTKQTATKAKAVIEKKDVKDGHMVERGLSSRIADIDRTYNRLRAEGRSRSGNLSVTADTPGTPDGPSPAAVVRDLENERICLINTEKILGWQEFWKLIVENREEENVSVDTKDHTVRIVGGGDGPRSIQGFSGSLDLGRGSHGPLRPQGTAVQGQPSDVGTLFEDHDLADGEQVP